MTATCRTDTTQAIPDRAGSVSTRHELERRLAHVLAELATARRELLRTQHAVYATEAALALRRQERESAAVQVADLADLAESLQQSLDQPAGEARHYAGIR